ncbi:hypothetical protein [Pedobacter sp.]|uniref:hypothetical protein n=1 Tax=Pedobacter sp. TaxID=1411316 RepID=UPI003BA8596F
MDLGRRKVGNRLILQIALFLCLALVNHSAICASIRASRFPDVYTTTVTFPAGYNVGDYVEFVKVAPSSAGAGGYYDISLAYTRNGVAAAATHLAAVSHSNPSIWREVGRINNNKYVDQVLNFTIDCNTEYHNVRFRIRAVNTGGSNTDPITVKVAVTSRNFNDGYTPVNNIGSDLSVDKFLPMTNDWDLYVGNLYSTDGASLAIKALQNGNVGIGTTTPDEKLAVNGKIHAREVRVDAKDWPDYVFKPEYKLPTLNDLEKQIKEKGHLPDMPSAQMVERKGLAVGEILKLQQQQIEELTLYMIEKDKEVKTLQQQNKMLLEKMNLIIQHLK